MGTDIGIPGDPEEAFRGECEGGGIVKFVDDEMDDIVWWGTEEMGRYCTAGKTYRIDAPWGRSQRGETAGVDWPDDGGSRRMNVARSAHFVCEGGGLVSSRAGSQSYKPSDFQF